MSAPFVKLKGMVLHPAFRHVISSNVGHFLQHQIAPQTCAVPFILVRHKGKRRFKAAPSNVSERKWEPQQRRSEKKEKVIPKNWAESFLSRVPQDDVWIRTFYPRPRYSLEQAMTMHREYAAPEMTNHPDALVHLQCKLDLRTKKKTKFVSSMKKTIVLPHQFDDGTQNRVIAICKTKEEKERAMEMGAVFAGGIDIIKALEKGEIHHDEFDHLVCTVDMLTEVTAIRKVLKDQMPHKARGTLGGDIGGLVSHFFLGRTFESSKQEDAIGSVKVTLGRLNMPTSELQANFDAYLESICSHRSPTLGQFITEAWVSCPPSTEKFLLASLEALPVSQRKEAAKLIEQQLEQEEEEQVQESDDEEEQIKAKAK